MNVERLHAIALALRAEIDQLALVTNLQALRNALDNQVAQPQQPDHQQQVSQALEALRSTLAVAPSEGYPATWRQTLDNEFGVLDFLGQQLLSRLNEIFSSNQITPSVAASEIAKISDRVAEVSENLENLLKGLTYFDVGSEELEPGEVEVSVLIPRGEVKEQLPDLGREFQALQSLFGPFLEFTTGSRQPLTVRSISSSDFGVYVDMAPAAAALVAVSVERLVALYKQLLEIRVLRAKLAEQAVPDEAFEQIDRHANSVMEDGIDAEVARLVDGYEGPIDGGRMNELSLDLARSFRAIANRIDHGYSLDVRAGAEPEGGEDVDEETVQDINITTIIQAGPGLKFLNLSGRPILSLPEGPVPGEAQDPPL